MSSIFSKYAAATADFDNVTVVDETPCAAAVSSARKDLKNAMSTSSAASVLDALPDVLARSSRIRFEIIFRFRLVVLTSTCKHFLFKPLPCLRLLTACSLNLIASVSVLALIFVVSSLLHSLFAPAV